MSVEEPAEKFEYQGYLVFNGVFKTNLIDERLENGVSNSETRLMDNLPRFQKGTAKNPGSGYELIQIRDYVDDHESIEDDLSDVGNSLIGLRYYYEEFSEKEAQIDGSRETVFVSDVKDIDVYWSHPDFLFIRGPSGGAEKAKSATQVALNDSVSIEELTFSGEFLLWVLYKYTSDAKLSDELEVGRLTDSETTGREDLFGKSNVVNESTDISKSVPLLTGLLSRKSLNMLEGHFTVGEFTVNAQIRPNRVHVKASFGDVANADPLRRVLISNEFLRELSNLRVKWESLPPKKRYPPLDFFYELYEECRDQGVRLEFSPDKVLTKYANLRGESLDEYDFA
ncbi:hypothetical protein [Haloferax volcanii]|uniref:hypothetical protein n=1 Tax=Haloferax volcanii TaxID=2246 RepID=UPI00385F9605